MPLLTIDHPERLDLFLAKSHKDISRRAWKSHIIDGLVLVDGKRAKAGEVLEIGASVLVDDSIFEAKILLPNPEVASLIEVVGNYEGLVLVNKPPLMPCHPLDWHETETLANGLCHLYPQFARPDSLQGGLLNRIDTETSGLVIAATDLTKFESFQRDFQTNPPTKTYLCLLDLSGPSQRLPPKGEIFETKWPIAHDKKSSNRVVAVGSPVERPYRGVPRFANSIWQVLERDDETALMKVVIVRGQFHQIRAHALGLGAPILGDKVYGFKKNPVPIHPHHLLHCAKTSIGTVDFYAPPPPHFAQELARRNWQFAQF